MDALHAENETETDTTTLGDVKQRIDEFCSRVESECNSGVRGAVTISKEGSAGGGGLHRTEQRCCVADSSSCSCLPSVHHLVATSSLLSAAQLIVVAPALERLRLALISLPLTD